MADGRKADLLKEGDKFGDYTVVRLLGKGGMGAVYLMRGTTLHQIVFQFKGSELVRVEQIAEEAIPS